MTQQLTTGAIDRILNGEDVSNAVMQILGIKKIPGIGNERYRLLISDGVRGCPFAMLGTQLNHMITNNELEKFTIVRVDRCVCNQVQANRKVIILLNLTVLVPGDEVNEKIGNPVNSSDSGTTTTSAQSIDSSVPNGISNKIIKTRQLTTGAIDRILNFEDVPNAVLQILGNKKIPGIGGERYRLLISDGVRGCPFVMLGTQLNHMIINNELEKFTIVRVDRCVCNEVEADRKVIILLKLTVLVPGDEVNEKIGNPVNSPASETTTAQSADLSANVISKPPYANVQQNSLLGDSSSRRNGNAVHPISSLTPYLNKWTVKVSS